MRKIGLAGLSTALFVALFFIGQARATTLSWDINGNIAGTSTEASRMQLTRDLAAYNSNRAGAGVSATVANGAVSIERAATLGIESGAGLGTAAKIAVRDIVTSPLASVGKGVVSLARLNPTALVGGAVASYLLDAGISYVSGQWGKAPAPPPTGSQSWFFQNTDWTGPYYDNPTVACQTKATASGYPGVLELDPMGGVDATTGVPGYYQCYAKDAGGSWHSLGSIFHGPQHCVTGYSSVGGKCVSTGPQVPATDADIQGAVQTGLTNKPSMAPDVIKNIYDQGGWVPVDALDAAGFTIVTPSVAGKSTLETSSTTAADGSTLTTTKTTTPSLTASTSGNTVTNNTINTSITNITTTVTKDAAGNTVSSGTTTSDKSNDAFQDSAMPDVPSLYTQKYPNGIAGVWNTSKPDISNTDFYNGVKSMFPSFGAGQCPVWRMTFNLGKAGNFGSGDLTVPCWIFQALGLVILATAAFTARKILF